MDKLKAEKLLEELDKYYDLQHFSLGLHTTNLQRSQAICNEGLLTGARALEGTIKFRGDLQQVQANDLNYFFPYTDHTVIIAIPSQFSAPRIEDNQGGYEPLCGFSRFFKKAENILPNHNRGSDGVLPNYYILGYYNKDYELTINPQCLLINEDTKNQFRKDVNTVKELDSLFIL